MIDLDTITLREMFELRHLVYEKGRVNDLSELDKILTDFYIPVLLHESDDCLDNSNRYYARMVSELVDKYGIDDIINEYNESIPTIKNRLISVYEDIYLNNMYSAKFITLNCEIINNEVFGYYVFENEADKLNFLLKFS